MRPAIREKKKVSATQKVSLLFDNRHVSLISWSKPIRDSEGRTPPSDWPWSRYSCMCVCVCVCVWRCVCCCCQTEREVSTRDARSFFSESALFSECLTVPPGFWDRWIYRKIKQTPLFSKLPQILRLDASCDVIAMRIQSKKGCFSVPKMEWTALRSHHARFTRATSDKRTESGTNPRYSFGLQTVYLLGPEPRAALDHATPLYTALGDTVNKVESITSLSDLVRSIQIRHRIMLKLQTSERTPLMWEPG